MERQRSALRHFIRTTAQPFTVNPKWRILIYMCLVFHISISVHFSSSFHMLVWKPIISYYKYLYSVSVYTWLGKWCNGSLDLVMTWCVWVLSKCSFLSQITNVLYRMGSELQSIAIVMPYKKGKWLNQWYIMFWESLERVRYGYQMEK